MYSCTIWQKRCSTPMSPHICSHCPATFDSYPELVTHRKRWHWDDYINADKIHSYEQLAAEGMIGVDGGRG
jgi:hypothetical protein